ncbi:hypothetical protein [Paraburkholderia xenovorans]|uniref:hypothetical protein n=1 Tax=Paraburkholderia xenovorans TaxID=36873 RepID=UPI0038BAEB63
MVGFLGQDRNWDGFNYHQYNGFALLHHKLLMDFAPAGMQTYFNPVPDVFYAESGVCRASGWLDHGHAARFQFRVAAVNRSPDIAGFTW